MAPGFLEPGKSHIMRRHFYHRHRHPRWPHFDNRGPGHYYDEYPERGRYADDYREERPPQGYYNDSDIYEDEFEDREDDRVFYNRPYDDRWPEDDYFRHRQQKQWNNESVRPWQRMMRHFYDHPRKRRGYPVDHHEHAYGRNIYERNGNRGQAQYPSHYREY